MFHCVILTANMHLLSTVRYDWAVSYDAACNLFVFCLYLLFDICFERAENEPQEQHPCGVFRTCSLTWQTEKFRTSDCFLPVTPQSLHRLLVPLHNHHPHPDPPSVAEGCKKLAACFKLFTDGCKSASVAFC